MIAGASCYHWNSASVEESARLYPQFKVRELPIELSKKEIEEMCMALEAKEEKSSFELLVYGRIPVMKSAQCLKKTTGHCNRISEKLYLNDKKGRKFPVTTHCRSCYNLIWQDQPGSLIGEDIQNSFSFVKRHRFELFYLTEDEIEKMKREYLEWSEGNFTGDAQKDEIPHHWTYGIE